MSRLALAAWPGLAARLVLPSSPPEGYADFRARGGYADGLRGAALIDELEAALLLGRGGAAFPAAVKWRAVAGAAGPRVVVANGEEGEPASVKDRYLLRCRPHLVLDGLLRAVDAVGATRAIVYVSDAEAAASVERAAAELPAAPVAVEVHRVERRYVAGEETAAVRALSGGPALPLSKPPRPHASGVDGRPTLVTNVETLAHVPFVAAHGAGAFRQLGTASSPGTFLCTLTGAVGRPGLYEVPLGVTIEQLVETLGEGFAGAPSGFLLGGYFGGVLAPAAGRLPLDYAGLRAYGSGLGCGSIHVIGPATCPVAVAAQVMAFLAEQSALQCGPCLKGTAAMRDVLVGAAHGGGDADGIARLERWSTTLPGRGACALLDGAGLVAASLLREFPGLLQEHLAAPCARCAPIGFDPPDVPGRVTPEMLKEADGHEIAH